MSILDLFKGKTDQTEKEKMEINNLTTRRKLVGAEGYIPMSIIPKDLLNKTSDIYNGDANNPLVYIRLKEKLRGIYLYIVECDKQTGRYRGFVLDSSYSNCLCLGDDFEFDDNFMPMYFKDVLINC
jgi:hypothetical protein